MVVAGRHIIGALLLATMLACGRTAFSERRDLESVTGDDDEELVPPIGEPLLCGRALASVTWSTPVQLTDVDDLFAPIANNPTYSYYDPTLRDDGLTLYITTDAQTTWRTFELTRASTTSPFTTIRQLPDDITPPEITVFGYQRVDAVNLAIAGGPYDVSGNPDRAPVYVLSDPRDAPAQWSLPANEDVTSNPGDARLTATGRTIVYASPGPDGKRLLSTQTRASLAAAFGAPRVVEGLPDVDVSAPWLSADERVLLFVRDDGQTPDTNKIWVAHRDAPDRPFGNAAAVNVNGEHFDGEPYVFSTATTCELYFISVRTSPYPRVFRAVAN